MSKGIRYVLLGAPASGKGTIAKIFIKEFPVLHISPGDLLRMHIHHATELGKTAKQYIADGKLLPDEIIIKLVMHRLKAIGNRSFLLDGYPRTMEQALKLEPKTHIDYVFRLHVPHQSIIERAERRRVHVPSGRVYSIGFNDPIEPGKDDITGEELVQRTDDKPEIVRKRLEDFEIKIKPIIDHYETFGIVHHFLGDTTGEIWTQMRSFIQKKTNEANDGK